LRLGPAFVLVSILVLHIGCSSKPAVKTKTFVNSREGLSQGLLNNYIDFSFDYSASWKLTPSGAKGNEQNFIKVERAIPGEKENESYTLEQFNVGHFSFTGRDQVGMLSKLAAGSSNNLSKGFPNYQKISEGPTQIGQYSGYEYRFKARVDASPKGPITFWGRCVMVLPNGPGQRGAFLIMLATGLAPEYSSEKDIGVKGELPLILNTFQLKE
jgi:hypothetical protein